MARMRDVALVAGGLVAVTGATAVGGWPVGAFVTAVLAVGAGVAACSARGRRLDAVLDATGIAALVLDGRGIVRRWNAAAAALFGAPAGAAVGRRLDELIASSESRAAYRPLQDGTAGRHGPWRARLPALGADGARLAVDVVAVATGRRWRPRVHVTAQPAIPAAPDPGTGRAPEWSERYRRVHEGAKAVAFEFDPVARRVAFGPEIANVLGWRSEEVDGGIERSLEFLHADDLEPWLQALEDVMGAQTARPVEFRARRRDGSWAHLRGHAAWLDGHVVGLLSDVTESRQLETGLARFFELSSDVGCVAGFDGRVRRSNATFDRTLGSPRTGGPATLGALLAPEDETEAERLRVWLAGGETLMLHTVQLRRRDGDPIWVEWHAVPSEIHQDIYLVGRDVSARVLAQRELEQLGQRAEAANRAKTEFLASVSHEIRTPLSAILGYAELAADDGIDEQERREMLATILRNGKHLLDIVNDILDLSKIEAGALDVERVPCSPARLVDEVVALLRVRADDKGIALHVVREPEVPEAVRSDPLRLRQILVNLIGNAIKFTERGSVTVRVATHEGRLRCDIEDTGIGMDASTLARLFRPFTQADSSTSRRYGGTGLGLALTKRLADLLGAQVTVRSELGRGSVFSVILPPTATIEGPVTPPPDVRAAEAAPADLRTGCRVLVAEDSRDNQELIAHILRAAGAEVVAASTGRIACDRVAEAAAGGQPFDLVLMDVQMPELDGLEATAAVRAGGHRLPIVALSADASRDEQRRCLEAGCDAFLAKPIDRRALVATVARYTAALPPLCARLDAEDDEALEALARDFAMRLPDVIDALARAVASNTEEARRMAHKLKGSAGSFGYPEVTACAARLEQLLVAGAEEEALREPIGELRWLGARVMAGLDTGD